MLHYAEKQAEKSPFVQNIAELKRDKDLISSSLQILIYGVL
jgi:hypothetical protein